MLLASTILAALSAPAIASSACLTLAEARTKYPNTHLKYFLEGRKHGAPKCWTGGTPSARVIRARIPSPRPEMTPQQRIDDAYGSFILVDISPPSWFTIRAKQVEGF